MLYNCRMPRWENKQWYNMKCCQTFYAKPYDNSIKMEHLLWQGMQQYFSISTQRIIVYNTPYVQLYWFKHVRKVYILSYWFDVLPGSWLQCVNNIIIDSYNNNPAITIQGISSYVDILVNAYNMNIECCLSKLTQLDSMTIWNVMNTINCHW